MVLLGIRQFRDPYYQGFAAQMSFYIMLSLVPTIIVLSQLLGFLDISLDFLDEWIAEYVAPSMGDTLRSLLNYRPAATSNLILIMMALWAASRAQFSMMRIANYTYSSGRTTGTFWRERFRAVKTMALTVFTPVSYTHLDVYKRQQSWCLRHRAIRSCFRIRGSPPV